MTLKERQLHAGLREVYVPEQHAGKYNCGLAVKRVDSVALAYWIRNESPVAIAKDTQLANIGKREAGKLPG